jgi:hypothetical protein
MTLDSIDGIDRINRERRRVLTNKEGSVVVCHTLVEECISNSYSLEL